jgi:RNA polymerase sigma-70 factor (ECF subfamily)
VFARRRGSQPVEAQDLTQAFFTQLLEKGRLRVADQERGRFRSFLLASFKHFMANESRRRNTRKRGGASAALSLDFAAAESRYATEPFHELTAERVFERRWAMTLLDNALIRLRNEYERADKLSLFEHLKTYLGGGPNTPPYKELGQQLGMSEGAIKVAVHRFRKRCREVLRAEIAETVASPEHVDDELRSLFAAVES